MDQGSARIAHLEKIAHDAVGKALPEAAKLVQDLEALRERSLQLAKAVVPAVSFEVQARKALERVGTTLAAITKGPDGKEAPLLTAVRWERLQKEVTHVLYVTTDSIATDVTTRRSILGTSGVLQYVTSANASWALVNVKTSAVARGGQVNGYDIMAHRLRDGVVTIVESSPQLSTATPLVYDNDRDRKERRKAVARDLVDPLSKLENVARGMVIALVISMILAFTALAFHSIAELIQSAWG